MEANVVEPTFDWTIVNEEDPSETGTPEIVVTEVEPVPPPAIATDGDEVSVAVASSSSDSDDRGWITFVCVLKAADIVHAERGVDPLDGLRSVFYWAEL